MSEEMAYISLSPEMRGGWPCIGDTRLEAECYAWIWYYGATDWPLDRMLKAWEPGLTRTGLKVACWFMVRHTRKRWVKEWRPWLREWGGAMAMGEWESVPLPPRKGEGA